MKLSHSTITWLIVWNFIAHNALASQHDVQIVPLAGHTAPSIREQDIKIESALQRAHIQLPEQPTAASEIPAMEHLQLLEAIIKKQYAECLICSDSRPMNQLQYAYCDKNKLMCRNCILQLNAPTCPYCREDLSAVPHINSLQAPELTPQQTQQIQSLERVYPYIAQIIKLNQAHQDHLNLAPHNQPSHNQRPLFTPPMGRCEKIFILSFSSISVGTMIIMFILGPVLHLIR
jgi:hypothetical protein